MVPQDDQSPDVMMEEEVEEGVDAQPHHEIEAAEAKVREQFPFDVPVFGAPASMSDLNEFDHLDPLGVIPRKLLGEAVEYFKTHRGKFTNTAVISVLDYAQRSTEPRFHVVDMRTGAVTSLRMSNGKGSEPVHNGFAKKFGNVPGQNMSSLGFVRTAETYQGKHGLSLRLDGLSTTNSNMRRRAVVVHGAAYVSDKPVVQGRSEGCPAVPMHQKDKLINTIKGGSLMYFALSKPV